MIIHIRQKLNIEFWKRGEKVMEIVIDGVVDTRENPINADDFLDKFIEWIEENHWYFGGTVREYNENKED